MSEDFTFQHLETDEDVEENLEIMRKVFGQNAGVDLLVKKLIHNHPKMTLKNHFIIKHQGKTVATLNLIPVDWAVGGVLLKVAEMGCVATLEGYRHRGLVRKLINEYHKEVEAQGCDLSVIEGIPYFYRQFGYDYSVTLDEETRIRLEMLVQMLVKRRLALLHWTKRRGYDWRSCHILKPSLKSVPSLAKTFRRQ